MSACVRPFVFGRRVSSLDDKYVFFYCIYNGIWIHVRVDTVCNCIHGVKITRLSLCHGSRTLSNSLGSVRITVRPSHGDIGPRLHVQCYY